VSVPPLRAAAALLLALAATVTGCGYTLRGQLPRHIQTVAVPIFTNRTQQPAVEGFLTRAIVEAFSTNGRLRVVHAAEADAILEGEVIAYSVDSIAFDAASNVRLYRLNVAMNLRMRDVRRNTVLFRTGFTEKADFRVLSAVSQTIALEETALRQAAADIGRAVVSLAIDRF
jgi:outer membrane lipopolysaccharide assembly protein LptE/RlpB